MKRKWRRVNPPGWLGPVGAKMGLHMEEKVRQPISKMLFNKVVDPQEPLLVGMTIGHWMVGGKVYDRKNHATHICISECGVVADYKPYEIADGRLPKTCYGCRPGEHAPPVTRIIPECDLPTLKLHFDQRYIMATAFEEQSQLDNHEGHQIWADQGRPVMTEIVNRTRFGSAFGWKCKVHKLVDLRHSRPKHHRVKINAIYKGERRFEMFVQCAGGTAGFTVSLSTGRSDVTFGDITKEVERAVGILQSLDDGDMPVETPKPAAAATSTNGHAGPIDLSRLLRIKAGIENLMTVGKDVNELAELKDKARKRVEAANAKRDDKRVACVKADEGLKAVKVKVKAADERVAMLEMQLRNAMAVRSNLTSELEKAESDWAVATAESGPAEDDAKAAEKELADLEALEADRLKSVGDAKGMAALLEALAKIGG